MGATAAAITLKRGCKQRLKGQNAFSREGLTICTEKGLWSGYFL